MKQCHISGYPVSYVHSGVHAQEGRYTYRHADFICLEATCQVQDLSKTVMVRSWCQVAGTYERLALVDLVKAGSTAGHTNRSAFRSEVEIKACSTYPTMPLRRLLRPRPESSWSTKLRTPPKSKPTPPTICVKGAPRASKSGPRSFLALG